jgi:hypothetical protein
VETPTVSAVSETVESPPTAPAFQPSPLPAMEVRQEPAMEVVKQEATPALTAAPVAAPVPAPVPTPKPVFEKFELPPDLVQIETAADKARREEEAGIAPSSALPRRTRAPRPSEGPTESVPMQQVETRREAPAQESH